MGLFKKVAGQFLPDAVDDFVHSPYDGEQYPKGTFGAVAVPGALEIELPPGKVNAIYRVYGTPRFWDASKTQNWIPPKFELEVMPAEDDTPRLKLLSEDFGKDTTQVVKAIGWSRMQLYAFEVPEPGGKYTATITGGVTDDQAHVVFKKD